METKKRTLAKTIAWRLFATTNSYLVLTIGLEENLQAAILMNITGFFVYYLFERAADKIHWGRTREENE